MAFNTALLSVFAAVALAVAVAGTSNLPPCENPINANARFCDPTLPIDQRVDDLVQRTLQQPASDFATLLGNTAGAVKALGLPPFQWWSEALHGVANSPGVTYNTAIPHSTSFPQVCTTAASFNRSLFHAIGDVIGTEGRAMNNEGNAGLTFWAPNLNLYVHPQWGRGQETPGEDPYLTSVYVEELVRGMQNNSLDRSRLRVSACCKHFAAYNLENWGGYTRFDFDAKVSEYDLNNTYLVAFEACVRPEAAGSSGIMCSYNAVNGVPSCANGDFMTTLARQSWRFDGYITSDCGAVALVQYGHNYTNSTASTVHAVMSAGDDLDCGSFTPTYLPSALKSGVATVADVRHALEHLFRVQLRLGYFDPVASQPFKRLNATNVDTPAARALALDAAREGIVMLNYNVSYLPFSAQTGHHVVVLGPNADRPLVQLGNYYGSPPYVISVLEGIRRLAAKVSFMPVLDGVADMSVKNYSLACEMIQDSSATTAVIVIGNDQTIEAEGLDRTSLELPGNQNLFVREMSECAASVNKQITVVVMSGGSVDYSFVREQRAVGGILWAGYPGQSGGQALAEILFGVVSPSGRLPHTVYPANYIFDAPMTDYNMASNATSGNPGRTYRYYTGEPVYPCFWGLTYTTWSLVVVNVSQGRLDACPDPAVMATKQRIGSMLVNITNTGARASAFSLLYKVTPYPPDTAHPEVGGQLSDFHKVFLQPGESVEVTLGLHAHAVRNVLRAGDTPRKFQWEVIDLASGVVEWHC